MQPRVAVHALHEPDIADGDIMNGRGEDRQRGAGCTRLRQVADAATLRKFEMRISARIGRREGSSKSPATIQSTISMHNFKASAGDQGSLTESVLSRSPDRARLSFYLTDHYRDSKESEKRIRIHQRRTRRATRRRIQMGMEPGYIRAAVLKISLSSSGGSPFIEVVRIAVMVKKKVRETPTMLPQQRVNRHRHRRVSWLHKFRWVRVGARLTYGPPSGLHHISSFFLE
ncbi:hypothetical protein B0H17DRAFT_1150019 [Mycena rosella]|uniref:Uncharacterized protein n=1 Tax=Mycena rosella TaxID=1033263 RepID=A0AAD7BVR3_MYCRO|nr:hypothetical protein B0H17DRAFT_1150019 [Mycena rosella]